MGKKNKKNKRKGNNTSNKPARSSNVNTIILVGITVVGAILAVFISH